MPLLAQSRADEIARQQARAETATPDLPSRVERFFEQSEQGKWFVGVPRGWYPAFGSVTGGGFTGGVGYQHYIGYDSYVDASALYSVANYKQVKLTASTPNHLGDRLDLSGSIAWADATQVPFYGLGVDSARTIARASVSTGRSWPASPLFTSSTGCSSRSMGCRRLHTAGGAGRVSVDRDRLLAGNRALLGQTLTYLRGEVSAAALWLASPSHQPPRRSRAARLRGFNPLRGGGDTFGIASLEVVQHIPVLRETWVLSLRGRSESVVRPSDVVPYFLMPYLGSGNVLRGYTTAAIATRCC